MYEQVIHPMPSEPQWFGYRQPSGYATYADIARKIGRNDEVRWAAEQTVLTAWEDYHNYPRFYKDELVRLPVEALAQLAIGLQEERSGSSKKAIATFQSVAKENPRLALAQLYMGQAYENMAGPGYTPAREAYAKAMQITASAPKSDRVSAEVRARVRKRFQSLMRPGDRQTAKILAAADAADKAAGRRRNTTKETAP